MLCIQKYPYRYWVKKIPPEAGRGGKHSNKEACYLAIGIIWMKNEDGLNQSNSCESAGKWKNFEQFGKHGTKDLLLLMNWNVDYERMKEITMTLRFLAFQLCTAIFIEHIYL